MSAGCKVVEAKGATATVRCDVGSIGVVRALARGGGCAGTVGESSLVVARAPQLVELPPCRDDEPGAVVTPPRQGWYYRPGIQSTGRLDLQLVPIVRETVVTYGCTEPEGVKP